MASLIDTRRYLTNFDSARTAHVLTDILVVGTGVAGCRAAIEAARAGLVTLVTKRSFEDSCTTHAQGGIAAAIATDDSPELHFDDTMRVGCGLNRPDAVRLLVADGPRCIEELRSWGFDFDRATEGPALTREGGHSVHRILHAHGDRTGQELSETIRRRVMETDNIRVFEECFLIDFLTLDGVCCGAVAYHTQHGHQLIWAGQTILASGGCGQLWRETTNPPVATGDGIAAAYRAGAVLRNMEMMQFHPTTLYVAGSGRALISEAVRGEGGQLVDRDGNRFMREYHADAELAPRDIVSRAIHTHLRKTRSNCVYLDVRHIKGFTRRFPQVARLCADFGVDVTRDLIPVRPSAHYMIGGVATELDGSTSLEGLLCCGEASNTGVHGANRLASNSLLEGLVFGKLAGETAAGNVAAIQAGRDRSPVHRLISTQPQSERTALDLPDIRNSLRSLMWRNVGIVRTEKRLMETCDILDFWAHYALDKTLDDVAGWETQDTLTIAKLVGMSALERTESVGVHFRKDGDQPKEVQSYQVTIARRGDTTEVDRVRPW